MPRKIGFKVVNSSSHEDHFSAKELIVHAPTVNGWRSSRLCSYPQHVTLQLGERCRVRKLQLLAHQYLIPAKVEFHIGDSLPEISTQSFPGQLRRLGYVSLSDNERTGFKARELKSIHVDAIGTYLRITFHRNYVNRFNPYNQVALVAINVLGESLDGNAFNTIPSREQLIDHYLNSTQQEVALDTTFMGEYISPLDDLAFDMYQDPEVAHIIRLLDQKKQDMVRQEKYEQAKNLKQAIADLQKVGERLARYDVEKRCAIEKEDYDLAKKKKELMEDYRKSVYQQLEVHNLLDMTMITKDAESSPAKDPPSLQPSPGHHSVTTWPLESTDTIKKRKSTTAPQRKQSDGGTVAPKPTRQPETPCTPAATLPKIDVTSVPYDDRPLPALQRKDRPGEVIQSPVEQNSPQSDAQMTPRSPDTSGEPEPLTENAQREAGLPIEVFGESLVAGTYSKTWSYREDALMAVHKKLSELSPTIPREELKSMIRAATFLVKKALLDQVSSVFHASLKLLRLLLSQLIPGLGLGRTEMNHCLDQTWPSLLVRTRDSASRMRTTAAAFIQEIAVLKDVRVLQVIPGELVKPFKSNFPARLAQSRAELIQKLLAELGTENSGFTLDNVMNFCTAALEHSASAVRELAVHIILSMYQQHRASVLSYLPSNEAAARKNFLYKTLFDGFAKIDGKLVETQTSKKGAQEEGEKEKAEIHSLQEQLAALKEITEREEGSTKEQLPKKEAPKVEKGSHKAGRAASTKVSQNMATESREVQRSINDLDNLCIFCGRKDESFTEDGLDLHYWKNCPMLRRCDECRQVVEIASLTEHLLGECESRSKFSLCPRCSEAVATEDLTRHVQGPACNPPISGKGSNHCPLCHNNFLPGEEAWKTHLMGREGCKQNSRRTAVAQRTQPAQGRAVGGAKMKQAWSAGARPRPMGRGSRIPALAPIARGHTPGKTPSPNSRGGN
ncbi:centrosomal protein of 104 kDa isoform X2 [Notolabrus celidotus]|uniref:centrosomal protein of 104 kDa isoform X2 n=1 Tax=Notolabrus celidotus TaxID=1203425 RepID=UPI0014900783|nr:centrosomal protein of 104 kDa isoform X2 [Notolabrus celidotus]XP_034552394.1 centrosomal protein of 104 kDa isoform X2 [Notolabrus celidotus]